MEIEEWGHKSFEKNDIYDGYTSDMDDFESNDTKEQDPIGSRVTDYFPTNKIPVP